jgi:hypothetical protein
MYRDVAAAFDFPDYFEANSPALDDCLGDVVDYDYGADEEATGTVLVLRHFDAFFRATQDDAENLLDIYARQARTGALIGHRMLCLVQSDDHRLRIGPLGGISPGWNSAEWLDSARGPGSESPGDWPETDEEAVAAGH